jgi:type II secretory pathway pseudopilin PulG
MVEVIVAMVIMSIAGGIFVSAVVTLSRTTNFAQAVTSSSTNNNQAYQSLDKTVRYASAISEPGLGPVTRDWYVELQDTTGGTEMCTQLRLDIATQQLQQRTWSASNIATLTTFKPIASGITNGAAAAGPDTQPFYLKKPTDTDTATSSQHQALTIRLESTSGQANGRVKSKSNFTLTALNSGAQAPTGAFCQQAARE